MSAPLSQPAPSLHSDTYIVCSGARCKQRHSRHPHQQTASWTLLLPLAGHLCCNNTDYHLRYTLQTKAQLVPVHLNRLGPAWCRGCAVHMRSCPCRCNRSGVLRRRPARAVSTLLQPHLMYSLNADSTSVGHARTSWQRQRPRIVAACGEAAAAAADRSEQPVHTSYHGYYTPNSLRTHGWEPDPSAAAWAPSSAAARASFPPLWAVHHLPDRVKALNLSCEISPLASVNA